MIFVVPGQGINVAVLKAPWPWFVRLQFDLIDGRLQENI